jgi:DNA-binding MurR/RpiR family transcriptional regulator
MTGGLNDPQRRLLAVFAKLTPELQRAARWVNRHPAEVGLWSMRRQAQALSVSPATKAAQLQADEGGRKTGYAHDALFDLQRKAVQSACELNPPAEFDAAARTMLQSRLVGFLGSRSSYGTAFQMRYAYQLVQRNGVLLDGSGSTLYEQADILSQGDALVVVSQAPYATQTLRVARAASERGVAVVALTDDTMSPLAISAQHVLLFRTESGHVGSGRKGPGSFFHTMAGPLALAEHLVARCAARGGQQILDRLDEVELRMRDELTGWRPATNSA